MRKSPSALPGGLHAQQPHTMVLPPNVQPVGGFVFYFEHPKTGTEVKVPLGDNEASGLDQLEKMVRATFQRNNIPAPQHLRLHIQHQICLRQPDPKATCFSGGIGDDLHFKVMKPVLLKTAAVLSKIPGGKGLAKVATKIGGCSGCSGRKTYKQGQLNMGRAGVLNAAGNAVGGRPHRFAANASHLVERK